MTEHKMNLITFNKQAKAFFCMRDRKASAQGYVAPLGCIHVSDGWAGATDGYTLAAHELAYPVADGCWTHEAVPADPKIKTVPWRGILKGETHTGTISADEVKHLLALALLAERVDPDAYRNCVEIMGDAFSFKLGSLHASVVLSPAFGSVDGPVWIRGANLAKALSLPWFADGCIIETRGRRGAVSLRTTSALAAVMPLVR